MRHVAVLIRFTWRYFSACTVFGALLFCVAPLLLGLATREFFDAVAGEGRHVVWIAVAYVGAVLAGEVFAELAIGRTWSGFCYETHTLLQRNVMAGILRGFGRFGLPVPPGDAISRFRDEPPSITMGSMDGIADLVGRGLFALVGGTVMWRIDPLLTIAAFTPVIVSSAVSDALGTRSARYGAAAREATGGLSAFLGELVGASLAVRVAGAASHVVDRLAEMSDGRRRLSLRDRVFAETVNSMNYHLVHVATGAVLLLGAGRIRSGSFSVGDFALFVVYLDQLTYLPAEIGRVLTELKRTRVSLDRLNALMPGELRGAVVAPAPIYVREAAPEPAPATRGDRLERLEVTGLSSVHPSSGRGVQAVSFSLERGSFNVVTGRIGSGKSTLLHALLGLLRLDEGEIRWNGRAVEDPGSFLVPPRASFTPQVPRLFSETLRENLLFGRQADDGSVQRAIHAAVLERDLESLPSGLDTLVGRRGVKLSGGQIQRLAAARMFLQGTELLVLDDLSSALDVDTESELWRRLLHRRGEVTTLVVSHSAIALSSADSVIALEDGRRV
ncbi:MAG TPA: ABC transporter ATP-binding protein [Acidimicrobiales bacterium]|nr:ABC transporter ATP-binding protein [Acidimicrobiales bacterium]